MQGIIILLLLKLFEILWEGEEVRKQEKKKKNISSKQPLPPSPGLSWGKLYSKKAVCPGCLL